jgi:UDP-3-O-[3-hydroxymyristoyl] glucosamine N-acyltransferase
MKAINKGYTLKELIHGLEATIQGNDQCLVTGVSRIQSAQPGHICYLINSLYRKHLSTTQASAVILTEQEAKLCQTNAIICRDPHYIYSQIAVYFDRCPPVVSGVHLTAVIGLDCKIHPSASIGAHCVLGNRVEVGADAVIQAGVVVGDDVNIGEGSQIEANVSIYHDVSIGKRVHLASGVVVGADGFGFATHKGCWHRVPQLGGVVIGDDVSIGANTSVDRGAVGDTVIESGVKLDNLIQVAHNVSIGANTIIAGCVAIAGSVVIGKNCMVGGGTCFAGHITVCDGVMITGMTAVTKSILEPGVYSSGIVGAVPNHEFRKNNARFHRLEQLMRRVKALENESK